MEAELASISIGNARLTDPGVEYLSKSKALRSLYLVNTEVTDNGLRTLAATSRLEHLYLLGNRTTPLGVEEFKSALPNCNVVVDDKKVW